MAKSKSKSKSKIASVLAFEKKLVPSDGRFYGTTWGDRYTSSKPLALAEKSVRGTISNRLKDAVKADPLKLNAEVEKPNLQTVDSCMLNDGQDTLKLSFSLRVLAGMEKPSACNNSEFQASYSKAAKAYIEKYGFEELGKRYASNIANGRFLWRNRVGANFLEVVVKSGDESWTFDSTEYSIRNFSNYDENIKSLGAKIAQALCGSVSHFLIHIEAYACIGAGQEVYPSEELIMDKGQGKKSKVLYSIDGIAGMHSQKIGNALRTVDTWYNAFDELGHGPIAAEPYGAVTNIGTAFRNPKEKTDFYTLFDAWALGDVALLEEDSHFVAANLVRGGVFGKSGKD